MRQNWSNFDKKKYGLFDSKLLFLNHSGFFGFFSSEKNRIKQSAIMYNFLFFFHSRVSNNFYVHTSLTRQSWSKIDRVL